MSVLKDPATIASTTAVNSFSTDAIGPTTPDLTTWEPVEGFEPPT